MWADGAAGKELAFVTDPTGESPRVEGQPLKVRYHSLVGEAGGKGFTLRRHREMMQFHPHRVIIEAVIGYQRHLRPWMIRWVCIKKRHGSCWDAGVPKGRQVHNEPLVAAIAALVRAQVSARDASESALHGVKGDDVLDDGRRAEEAVTVELLLRTYDKLLRSQSGRSRRQRIRRSSYIKVEVDPTEFHNTRRVLYLRLGKPGWGKDTAV